MSAKTGLQVDYRSLAEREPAGLDGVLGVVTFDDTPRRVPDADVPLAQIRTPVLNGNTSVCEIWRTTEPVESGQQARVRYRRAANVLFGCIAVPELEARSLGLVIRHAADVTERSALHAATEEAYREIFATLDSVGYGHLLRVWNYLPEINLDSFGTERYWQFNKARRDALIASGRDVTGNVPAACALGSATGSPLVIYFLASKSAPVAIENPRQINAYDYPPKYGPRPVFARASMLQDSSTAMLFISGTASIVGHETCHVGDAGAQTRESLVNVEALLGEANRVARGTRFGLRELVYKVYVRHSSDLPAIQAQFTSAVGPAAPVVFLRADICRPDLLVEIEAIGRHSLNGDT